MQKNIIKSLLRKLESLERTRKRAEALHTAGELACCDIESVYEGLFLRGVVSFESTLEQLFFAILNKKTTYPASRVDIKVSVSSGHASRQLALQGKDFLDWLPYSRTEERAKIYFRGGKPFTLIQDGNRNRLMQIMIIRNAIAHASGSAASKFKKKVIGNTNLLSREKSPAGFLRSHTSPNTTRFQIYIGVLAGISQTLQNAR